MPHTTPRIDVSSATRAAWITLALRLAMPFYLWASLLAPACGQAPGEGPAPEDSSLTVAGVEAMMAELEASTNLEAEVKAKALETYRTALSQLQSAAAFSATLESYKEMVESGPAEIARIREETKKPRTPVNEFLDSLSGRPLTELDGELTKELARLATAEARRSELAGRIAQFERRPGAIRDETTRAKERLQQIEAELQAPPAEANIVMRGARATLLRARKAARTIELQTLEQEIVIYQTRLDLTTAQRDLAEREVLQLEARTKGLRDLVDGVRRAEAERERDEAERTRRAARGKHPTLVNLAETNARLSNEFAQLTARTEDANRTHRRILDDLKTVEDDHKSARTRLDRVGLSSMLGEIFLEQRKNVPDVGQYRQLTAQHGGQIASVRLGQFNVDERRRKLIDPEATLRELTTEAAGSLDETAAEQFTAEARKLLGDQLDLLGKVDAAYARYLRVLSDLDIDQRQLAEAVSAYRGFLDDHLLWTPSTSPIGAEALANLGPSLAWLLAPENWIGSLRALRSGMEENPMTVGIGLLALGGLIILRRRMRQKLESFAGRVGRKQTDSFKMTVAGLLLTAVLASSLAAVLWLLAWMLLHSGSSRSFDRALGAGLAGIAVPVFLLQFARHLCHAKGVGDVHFRWRESTLILIRRSAFLLLAVGLPAMAITILTEAFDYDAYRHSLGRVAFVFAMITLGVVAARFLAPTRGVFREGESAAGAHWLTRLRRLWLVLGAGVPFAIAVMAIAGYYYTALQLERRVLLTVTIIVVAVILYHLILRWLVIARTRLAIARAREKREAALALSDALPSEDKNVELELPEIDLATVKAQAQRLFGTAVVFATLISLLAIWAPVLPALAVLDRELWTVYDSVGGEEVVRSITIASVLLAVLIALLGLVASRNLPGLLELAMLRKLSLDAGSRYAISTIGQYLLVTVGVALAFRTVGVAWSHVQWLVAALSVGLGFGLQEIFANFVSGLIILLERPIRVGDTVTVGDISGTVTRVRIRATTITDWDYKELVVPNKSFITGQLINWSLSNPITRLVVNVGIAYGSDTEKALRLMIGAATSHPSTLADPEPAVFFVGFGDSALNFEVRVFVKELSNRARTRIVHDIHMAIDKAFRENDIVIAFPQRDIHIKSNEQLESPASFGDGFGRVNE